jgi:hypothetical protein
MGQILTEDQLEFDFRAAISSIKFDDRTHGLSHCMNAVDFIVETDPMLYMIEVKDLDNPNVPPKNAQDYYKELLSGKLISNQLVPKARDSYLYNYLLDRLPVKPRIYIALIAFSALQPAELSLLSGMLQNTLPLRGPFQQPWSRPYFDACIVMDLPTWNNKMNQFPVRRML